MANAEQAGTLSKYRAVVVSASAVLLLAADPCLAASEGSQQVSREFPRDLYEFALKQGCVPPADFYSARPGLKQAPYVYADTREAGSAVALWCHERGQPEGVYTMLFRPGRGSVGQAGCAPRIRNRTHIGGLSLVTGYKSPLSAFFRVRHPPKRGPADVRVSAPVIRSEYDGVVVEYYCHRGDWFERAFD